MSISVQKPALFFYIRIIIILQIIAVFGIIKVAMREIIDRED